MYSVVYNEDNKEAVLAKEIFHLLNIHLSISKNPNLNKPIIKQVYALETQTK
jgi:hypothetical protein